MAAPVSTLQTIVDGARNCVVKATFLSGLYWDAPPNPIDMLDLNGFDHKDFRHFGGLTNNGGPNASGSILVSTQGFTLGYQYTIILEMIKGV